MRHLGIQYLKEGMKVGKNIYKSDGNVLLGKGVELKREYIEKLPSQGITSIYVECDVCKDIDAGDILSEKMRIKCFSAIKNINDKILLGYNKFKNHDIKEKEFNSLLFYIHKDLHQLAIELVEDFQNTKAPMFNLIDTRVNEDYIYAHMTNVAALSIYLGMALGYDYEKLVALVKGCLVHDIGIILSVPSEIRNKQEKLSNEEMQLIQKHPEIGYAILRKMD